MTTTRRTTKTTLLVAALAASLTAPATFAEAGPNTHPGFGPVRAVEMPGGKARAQRELRARTLPTQRSKKRITVCKESFTEFTCTTQREG